MSKITVLGGMGQMGRIVSEDLADAGFDTVVVDRSLGHDVKDETYLKWVMRDSKVVVGCLPSFLGRDAMQLAVSEGYNYVDLSFAPEDLTKEVTVPPGVTALIDCGWCPGLADMIAGDYLRRNPQGKTDSLDIYVGGISADPASPMGYVVTWCVEDLIEEHLRLARYKEGGSVKTANPLADSSIKNYGKYEVFRSDGLRTLLKLPFDNMAEWTIRRPGYLDAVKKMNLRTFDGREEFRKAVACGYGDDLAILAVDINGQREATMRVSPKNGVSAMARTTALTCATVAQMVAYGTFKKEGLFPPYHIGLHEESYSFLKRRMSYHGITW